MSQEVRGAVYLMLSILGAVLAAIGQQIQSGAAPIPPEYAWLSPVLVAAIIAATGAIKSVKGE